eukprot:4198996-Pyramimonas_sp.AAC.1
MAGFKRMVSASSTDNGLMEHLLKDDAHNFDNLEALAISNGWRDDMTDPTVNCELKRLPRTRPPSARDAPPRPAASVEPAGAISSVEPR